jgi:hypothetical protein
MVFTFTFSFFSRIPLPKCTIEMMASLFRNLVGGGSNQLTNEKIMSMKSTLMGFCDGQH